jgi:integrase
MTGQKVPFKLKEIYTIRVVLQLEHNTRELALFNTAIDSKTRSIDLVNLKVEDVLRGDQIVKRAKVVQRKTKRPVTFEITPTTRRSMTDWIGKAGLKAGDYLFPSRVRPGGHLSTRQYARIVKHWAEIAGTDPSLYGTHSLRRTKATILYAQTHDIRAIRAHLLSSCILPSRQMVVGW